MKIKDGIIGLVVGDALGVPYEFSSREEMRKNPVNDMIGYGTYNMPPGTFSDDSSLTIATMRSIINQNKIDYQDILNEFVEWYKNSKYTQYNKTFDIGNTTLLSIENFIEGTEALKCGKEGQKDNGNGSLMRILPLAFIDNIKYETVENVSSLTHRHDRSKIACVYYVELAKTILNEDVTIKEAIKIANEKIKNHYKDNKELKHYDKILNESIFNIPLEDIKSSGYVVNTLESVVYILLNTNNYKDAVLEAVNLGQDTDTIAAIVGGIAGIYYGYESIPQEWINKVKYSDKIIKLCTEYEKALK